MIAQQWGGGRVQRTGEGWIKVREDARVLVDGSVELAPDAGSTAAQAHVLGLGWISEGSLDVHLSSNFHRLQLGQVGGRLGLAQHTALHHLPQQHTNTAENV